MKTSEENPPNKREATSPSRSEESHTGDGPPRKKKQKSTRDQIPVNRAAEVNRIYLRPEFMEGVGSAFRDGMAHHDSATAAAVLNEPFTCCVLPNFVRDTGFLECLKEELLDLEFSDKSNDLYKFHQSDALQNCTSPCISALRRLLYEDFLSWLREVTGISFTTTVDMTCSKYNYTDVLLCHDDELEGRRIAFILYLVADWQNDDGGSLDLFNTDDHGQPQSIVKTLVPKWNNFVFFEVTPKSFHQVSEIVNPDKCRLSVSGWFHGPTLPRPAAYIEPRNILSSHVQVEESVFYDWLNENYLDLGNQSEVQDTFSDESEIQLSAFLENERFDAVLAALQSPEINWKRKGPANKRQYECADVTSLPPVVQECLNVMQSEQMFLLLSNFTALKLHAQAPCSDDEDDEEEEVMEGRIKDRSEEMTAEKEREEPSDEAEEEASGSRCDIGAGQNGVVARMKPASPNNPHCRAEIRRWTHGGYTLLHDTDTEGSEFALDASVFFNTKDLIPDNGGYVSYIAKGEDEELLSVLPEDNSLSLVYRDKETLRFVKHINHSFVTSRGRGCDAQNSPPAFYELYLVYYE